MRNTNIQFLISTGNISDGFEFVGPFADVQDAINHSQHMSDDWHVIRAYTHGFTFILGDGCTNDHYVTYVAEADYSVAMNVAMVRAVEAWHCELEDIELVGAMYGDCVAVEWANSGGKHEDI